MSIIEKAPSVIVVRYFLRLLSFVALAIAVIYISSDIYPTAYIGTDILSLLPGLGLFWLADKYTPIPVVRNNETLIESMPRLKSLWLVGGLDGLIIGSSSLWHGYGEWHSYNEWAFFSGPLSLCTLLAFALIIWRTRMYYARNNYAWQPFRVAAILLASYTLAMIAALLVVEWRLGLSPYDQFYYRSGYFINVLQIAGIVLLVSTLVAEYGLPRQLTASEDWTWPMLNNDQWFTFLIKYRLQFGAGVLIGLCSGLLPWTWPTIGYLMGFVPFMPTNYMPFLPVGLLIIAMGSGVYGIFKPIMEHRKGIRTYQAKEIATSILLGFAPSALVSMNPSVYIIEFMIFTGIVYLMSYTAFRLFINSASERQISS